MAVLSLARRYLRRARSVERLMHGGGMMRIVLHANHVRAFLCAVFVLVIARGLVAVPAQDPSKGRATVAGQEAVFVDPVGFWNPAAHRASIAFVSRPLGPAVEATSRQAGAWNVSGAGPAVVLTLEFKPTSMSGMVNDLVSCRMTFVGFTTPLEIAGGAEQCHVISSGGMLRGGGALIGLLEGKGATYSYRLPFSVAFMEAVTAPGPAVPVAATPPPAVAPHTVAGTAEYNGQKLTVSQGLAWWTTKDSQIELGLFDRAPRAGILKELRSGEWGAGGPVITMTLRVAQGAAPTPASVSYCYVNVTFPKGGPLGVNTNGKGCGLSVIGGELKPGGNVIAVLKGQAPGPNDKPYSWDLRMNLPIAP